MFGKSKTPSFILTLSLPREKWQIDYLNKLFRVCGNISNDLIDDRRKALSQLERNREWKAVQAGIAALKKKGEKENIDEDVLNKMLKPLYDKRSVLLEQYGMDEAAFQTRMKKWSHHYKGLVHSQVAQKLASSVWKKFEGSLYGEKVGISVSFQRWAFDGQPLEPVRIFRAGDEVFEEDFDVGINKYSNGFHFALSREKAKI